MTPLELDTPHGTARAHLDPAPDPRGALVLGHGAGGSVTARDLVAVGGVAREAGLTVVLVEQPYRVAGRRSSPPARQLDAAWTAVLEQLRASGLAGLPLVVGGRSAGARVACRTAGATGAAAVLCLAFPLLAPSTKSAPVSRLPELDAVGLPALVVQGASDRFGVPPAGPDRRVVVVRGDHRLTTDLAAVVEAVRAWLPGVVAAAAGR
ncbi:MAG: alpha/beta hydrolase family protein [Solirubrobacteraceae bacterium]